LVDLFERKSTYGKVGNAEPFEATLLSGDELYADVKSWSHVTKPDFWKTDTYRIFFTIPSCIHLMPLLQFQFN
jgi:hypothetical protein